MDQCLGCMACVTACPSGVQYDKLIEATRAQVERSVPPQASRRALPRRALCAVPLPRAAASAGCPSLWLYQRVGMRALTHRPRVGAPDPGAAAAMERCCPWCAWADALSRRAAFAGAQGTRTPAGGRATRLRAARVLRSGQRRDDTRARRRGLRCRRAARPGLLRRAQRACRARGGGRCAGAAADRCVRGVRTWTRSSSTRPAAAPRSKSTATCCATIRIRRAGAGVLAPRCAMSRSCWRAGAGRAAAPAAAAGGLPRCLPPGHAQGVRDQPRALLRRIPGWRCVDIPEGGDLLRQRGHLQSGRARARARAGRAQSAHVISVAPEVVATANPGCLLQISAALRDVGHDTPAVHPIELVDASIRGAGVAGARRAGVRDVFTP